MFALDLDHPRKVGVKVLADLIIRYPFDAVPPNEVELSIQHGGQELTRIVAGDRSQIGHLNTPLRFRTLSIKLYTLYKILPRDFEQRKRMRR